MALYSLSWLIAFLVFVLPAEFFCHWWILGHSDALQRARRILQPDPQLGWRHMANLHTMFTAAAHSLFLRTGVHEIFDYKPNLLILDYGKVDPRVRGDDLMPNTMQFPDTPMYSLLKRRLHFILPVLEQSIVFAKFYGQITRQVVALRMDQFKTTMRALVDIANEHHTPVILLRQVFLKNTPAKVYEGLTSPTVKFVDTDRVLRTHVKRNPDEALASPGWLNEVGEVALKNRKRFRFRNLRTDYYHLNPRGHRILAERLAGTVLQLRDGPGSKEIE